jgi:HSP20 family molecular chaperone IbpA
MTSIEWLVKELKLEGYDHTIKIAKEMERKQIEESFKHGRLPVLFGELTSEQYYQETFKKD